MTHDKRGRNRPAIPTILVVDDSSAVRQLILGVLVTGGYRVIEAANGSAALEACRSDRPDLVLLGIDMPVMDGHATMREMRADADLYSVPVLFLTTRADDSDVTSSSIVGAQNYLCLPCEPAELIARVDAVLRTKSTEDALARQTRDMNELGSIDTLTGLGNRRRVETRILEVAATHGPRAVATVVMVGIDDFKAINHTFGHAVGDVVLRIVARRLRGAAVDERVLVCRWGGDEFLAAGVGLDPTESYALAEQLRYAIAVTPFATGADQAVPVTVSAGCATGTLAVYGAVLEAAAAALYQATQFGGNRVVMASPS